MIMKKLVGIMIVCMAIGCKKAELMEDREPDNGRNATEERTDTVDVKPSVDADGWEGSVDVGFEFG